MPKMKECKRIKKLLPLFITADLRTEDQELVRKHLGQCIDCQDELRAYQSLHDLLACQSGIERDESFWKDYWKEIEAKIQRDRPKRLSPQPTWVSPLVRIAAVFLVGLAIGYLGYHLFPTPVPDIGKEPSLVHVPLPSVETPVETLNNKLLGVKFQPVSTALSQHLGLPPGTGMMICDFLSPSPARTAGLEPGDIVLELNGQPLQSCKTKPGVVILRLDGEVPLPPEVSIRVFAHVEVNIDKLDLNKLNLKILHAGKIITKQITIRSNTKRRSED